MKIDLRTSASRRRLKPYREPYWEKFPPALMKGASLGFRRSPVTEAETWHVRVYVDGRYISSNLGAVSPDFQYKEAYASGIEWARAIKTAGPSPKQSFNLHEVIEEYLGKLQGNSSRRNLERRQQAEKRLDALIPQSIKLQKVNGLSAQQVSKIQRDYQQRTNRQGNPISPESVNRVMTHLIAALNHGYRLGMIESDVAWKHYQRLPEEPHKRKVQQYVPCKDRQRFIKDCPKHLRRFVRALHLIGARPSELRRLRVSDVDLDEGSVQLMTFKGKARIRKFPLPDGSEIRRLFENQVVGKSDEEFVFTTTQGKPWTQANLAKVHKMVRKEVELPESFDTYSWRHCRISDFVRAGFPAPEVAALTGTSLQFIEQNYYKPDTDLQSQMASLS